MARVETVRFGMNMPAELMKQVDDYADRMNISKSSAVCVLLSQALSSQKAMNDLGELLRLVKEEQDKQTVQE